MTRRTVCMVILSAVLGLALSLSTLSFGTGGRTGVDAQVAACNPIGIGLCCFGIGGFRFCLPPPFVPGPQPPATTTPATTVPPPATTVPPPTQAPVPARTATQTPTQAPTQTPTQAATQPPTAVPPPAATATPLPTTPPVALPAIQLNFGTPTPTEPPATTSATASPAVSTPTPTLAAPVSPSAEPPATVAATATAATPLAPAGTSGPVATEPPPATCLPGPPPGEKLALQVLSGNDIPRRPGCETAPPIAVVLQTLPAASSQASRGRAVQGAATGGTTVVATITNYTIHSLNLHGTVVFDLGAGAQVANVSVSTGTAVIQGSQVVWNNFSLAGGERATATISLEVASGGAIAAAATPAFSGVSVEAVDDLTGEQVIEQSGSAGPPISTLVAAAAPGATAAPAQVSGVTSPGLVAAAAAAAGVGGSPVQVAAAAPAGAAAPVTQLPTTGSGGLLAGPATGSGWDLWLPALALALLIGGGLPFLCGRRRRL